MPDFDVYCSLEKGSLLHVVGQDVAADSMCVKHRVLVGTIGNKVFLLPACTFVLSLIFVLKSAVAYLNLGYICFDIHCTGHDVQEFPLFQAVVCLKNGATIDKPSSPDICLCPTSSICFTPF